MIEATKEKQKKGFHLYDYLQYLSVALIVLLVIGFSMVHENFLSLSNIRSILTDGAPLMVMSVGMTLVLLLGGIDLSVGSCCSVAHVLFVKVLADYGTRFASPALAMLTAFLVAMLFGLFSGALLGVIHVTFKVPSYIASLSFMSVWQSVALLITAKPQAVPKALWPYATEWFRVMFGVVGLPFILALVVVAVLFVFLKFTATGSMFYAVGGNERTARMAGIDVNRVKIIAFCINGVCAALGGVFLAAKFRSSAPTIGDSFTLLVIVASVLGGTSLTGGKGGVLFTVLGVLVVTLVQNGMNFIGVPSFWQNVVFGAFILVIIAISTDRSTRGLIVK